MCSRMTWPGSSELVTLRIFRGSTVIAKLSKPPQEWPRAKNERLSSMAVTASNEEALVTNENSPLAPEKSRLCAVTPGLRSAGMGISPGAVRPGADRFSYPSRS